MFEEKPQRYTQVLLRTKRNDKQRCQVKVFEGETGFQFYINSHSNPV